MGSKDLHSVNAGEVIATLLALAAAGASGALLFAVAEGGYASFPSLIVDFGFPGAALLIVLSVIAYAKGWKRLFYGILIGALAGAVGWVGLEIVRIIGFRAFGAMPGSMPELMGVLLTHRIMDGPNTLSNIAGWGDHLWNGAMYGIIFALIFGGRRPVWVGLLYTLLIGTGFMLSPVARAIGAGGFGFGFSPLFMPTVYTAHIVFGLGIVWIVRKNRWISDSLFTHWFSRSAARGRR